jgi:hypothetical protein
MSFKITFTSRPVPLFPSYRPLYRISLMLLVLKLNSVGGKASLLKMHLFSWGFKSNDNLKKLAEFVTSNFQKKLLYFGIEPSLNRALDLAIGEGLISSDGYRYAITAKGEDFVSQLLKDDNLFILEKQILATIGKNINEKRITELENFWKNA